MVRRTRWAAVAFVVSVLAGCTSAPAITPPPAITCRPFSIVGPTTEEFARPVDCAAEHSAETVHSGTFRDSEFPDRPDSSELAGAEKQCDEQVTARLGTPWRDYRLDLHLTWPAEADWRNGQRWYHCDVLERAEAIGAGVKSRTTTIGSGLAALLVGCMEAAVNGDDLSAGGVDVIGVDCGKPHNAEYAGSLVDGWTQSVIRTEQDRTRVRDGCLDLVTSFLGVAAAGTYRALALPIPSAGGSDGAFGYRCLLWLGANTTAGSAKGQGTKVPGWA